MLGIGHGQSYVTIELAEDEVEEQGNIARAIVATHSPCDSMGSTRGLRFAP